MSALPQRLRARADALQDLLVGRDVDELMRSVAALARRPSSPDCGSRWETLALLYLALSEHGEVLAQPRLAAQYRSCAWRLAARAVSSKGVLVSRLLMLPLCLCAGLLPAFLHAQEASAPPAPKSSYETILVTGAHTDTATKTDVDVLTTPQNVQVLSGELLADQGAILLEDALRNVAGVMPGGYYNGWDYYRIRGFDSASSTYQDGLLYSLGVSTNAELFGMERVEILKGPSSSLYGQGAPGGIVNLISKRPQEERAGQISASIGTDSYGHASLDVTGPLSEAHGLSGRLVTLYRNDGSFVDHVDGVRRIFVAPSLTWRPRPDTTITFLNAFTHDRNEIGFPLPADGFVKASPYGKIPRDRLVGDAEHPGLGKEWKVQTGYLATHEFNETFSLRQNLRASWSESDWDRLLYPAFLDADERTLYRYPYFSNGDAKYLGVDTGLDASFETGSLSHVATFGVDVYRSNEVWRSRQIDYSDPASYLPLDLYDPEYGQTLPPLFRQPNFTTDTDVVGVYLQDQIRLPFGLTLTAGGRYDWAETNGDNSEAFSPRVGLSYEIIPSLVAYVSYSRSFAPQSDLLANGDTADPERGTQWEIGAKSELYDGRLNATFSLYQLTREDVATDDPGNPGFVVTTGEQESRGVELDAQVLLAEGWELIAAYAYTDAEVTKDNALPDGLWTRNAPKHGFSSWLKYTVLDGPLAGLGLGLGVSHYTKQAGDLSNTFFLPKYTLVDANATYTRGPYLLQLNLDNLGDERYADGSYDDLYVLPGRPRRVRLLASWAF